MADTRPDLSYVPPSDAEVRADALRRRIEEPAPEEGSRWFSAMSPAELAMQGAFLGLGLTDWGQTINFTQGRPGGRTYEEANPVLGRRPSRAKVNLLVPLGLAAHTLGSYALPRPWRNVLQVAGLLGEGAAVYHNARAGISPTWPWK